MTYNWTDNPTEAGVSEYSPDVLNENLMHLKYDNKSSVSIGVSSTSSATAEKAVTLSGFVLTTGATIQVTFTNANTANVPTLNVNGTGAKSIYSEDGTIISATNPAYFPAGATVEFTYNGTYWIYKNRVVTNYVNGTGWYKQWANGWIEQGGALAYAETTYTLTFPKAFKNANYTILKNEGGTTSNAKGDQSFSFYNLTSTTAQTYNPSSAVYNRWYSLGY